MHACPVGAGDAWLRTWIPAITATPSYRAGKTVVFVAWDEDDGSASNRVPLLVVSRHTAPGTRNATAFTHYSLLRTTEELLGLRTRLGNAATAASMRAAFGL
jgi:phospholipase C